MTPQRYTVSRKRSADGTPVTEILDHKRQTCSRLIDHYPDSEAIEALAAIRRSMKENRP